MQHEHAAFGRAEPLQHDEQGQAHGVVERDPVGRVRQFGLGDRDELDLGGVVRALAPGPGRADLVQAQAAGDHDQPAAQVLDLSGIRPQQPAERLLHHILRRPDLAQHPEG